MARLIRRSDPADEDGAAVESDRAEESPDGEPHDLLTLLDRLEQALLGAGHIPLTSRVVVNEEDLYALLDQLRTAAQAGVRHARAIVVHRDRILADAREEAEHIVADAEAQAAARVAPAALGELAEQRRRELVAAAGRRVREIERDADEYAGQVLLRLRDRLRRVHEVVEEDETAD